ncbi:MAG TPA: DUF2933 domain-containing protein [Methanosarcina sp.]|nr:DUF2933 domain-containing protein [Methanosarcina sp.]
MKGVNINFNNFTIKAMVVFILATIAFYLLTEHKAHLLAYSSYMFFFAYVLLHFFMCGRHGKHEEQEKQGGHCGHSGHDSRKHKHGEAEKGVEQGTGRYDDTGQHENSHYEHSEGRSDE